MKQLFRFSLLLLALLLPATATAHDFEVDGIYYRINGNEVIVTSYNTGSVMISGKYDGDITIPATVTYNETTYSVTAIDGSAFWGCSTMTSINIPNSITEIADDAFEDCSGLISIIVASDNPKYDSRDDCNAIIETASNTIIAGCNNTIIPNSVSAISIYAFRNRIELTSIIIPSSVTEIGDGAFSGCSGLTSIIVESDNTKYDSRDNCNAIIETSTNTLITGCLNTVIPNSTISIGYSAFNGCTGLTGVIIPDSVTSIGGCAFMNCSELASIFIPNSITNVGADAFYGTSWFDNKPDGVVYAGLVAYKYKGTMPSGTRITLIDGTLAIATDAFAWQNQLRSITIPNSVTYIGDYAFADCRGWTGNLTIPNSVTYIGESAFSGCSGLYGNLTIPNSVTYIGESAFSGCSGLNGDLTIPYSITAISDDTFFGCQRLTNAFIPNSVTSIGKYAFMQCYKLTSITIPDSIISIGDGAFSGCSGLTGDLIIPNSVTYIGDYAFSGCSGLTGDLIIPNSVTSISNGAFSGCSGLTGNLTIPSAVTYIGNYAFYNCTGLTGDLTIPSATTYIGEYAFSGCTKLGGDLVIPNSVSTIGASAFNGCIGLTSVNISDSVSSIGTQAFMNCPVIESVTCSAVVPPVCDGSLFNTNVYIHSPLYVPMGTEKSYMYDQGWGQFINIIGIKTQDDVVATEITLDQSVMSMILGTSSQLVATILPDSTTNKAVSWASSNPNVATVDENGVVTAMGLGNSLITAVTTDGSNLSATCRVIVTSMSNTNGFSVADAEVMHGKEIVIPVAMNNDQTILAFQTDICLPEGFSIVMDEDDEYMISPSNRLTEDHILMANGDNGAVSVVCYTPEGRPIGGNSGDDLFYITVQVPEDASGDYVIYLRNSRLTTADYTELRVPDVGAVVTVKSYIPGDANDSRTVTVTDIVVTAQYVLQMNPEPFIFEAADMNGDGDVTVTDIMLIAYLINHPTMNAPKRMPALEGGNDSMSGEDVTLMAGETRKVSIQLNNEMDYTAFQLDLTLPAGLTASNFQLTDRAGSHTFDVNTLSNGKTRALCYSPAIEVINGHEGALLTFDITATDDIKGIITVDGIELVTTDCQTVRMNSFTIGVNSATRVNELNGAKTVARVDYFNLAGQQIDRPGSGVTLVVTTYTDGTSSTTKVIK